MHVKEAFESPKLVLGITGTETCNVARMENDTNKKMDKMVYYGDVANIINL